MIIDYKNRDRFAGLLIFVFAAVVYGLTCCRTVFVGDSGELTLALTTGGIAHPPGYPLYTVLGYIWLKVFFFLRPALAANLFSAAAAASISVVLYQLLKKISDDHLPSIMPASISLLFAFSFPVWSSATNAEVYAFSGLLYASALYNVIRFHRDGHSRSLLIAAFFCGLTLTHHYSAGVVMVALFIALVYRKGSFKSRIMVPAAIFLLLPLTIYFYLLVRFDPALPVNWLSEKSMAALWGMVSGANYRQFAGWPMPGDLLLFARKTAVDAMFYFGPGAAVLAIPGLIIGLTKKWRLTLLIVIPAALNLMMVAIYHIPDYVGYLMPSLMAAATLIFLFIEWLRSRYRLNDIILYIVAGLLALYPLAANYSKCDLSDFRLAERYGEDLLDSAAPHSIVLLKSDNGAFTTLYLRYAEDYRSDLEVYSVNSTLARLKNRFKNHDLSIIMAGLESGTDRVFWGTEYIINQGMNPTAGEKAMRGMLYGRLGEDDDPDISQRIASFIGDQLPHINLKDDPKARQIYLEYQLYRIDRLLREGVTATLSQDISELLIWAERIDDPMTCMAVAQFFRARGMIDPGLRWIDLARDAHPFSYEARDLFVNLGTIYRQAGDLGLAGQALSKALEIDPGYQPARYNANLIRAEMALNRKDWTQALEAFGILAALEPQNPLPYYNMAVIYERMPGRTADAIKHYRIFIDRASEEQAQAVERARRRIEELQSSDQGQGEGL